MTSFESIYVGHFISDGKSLRLRRALSLEDLNETVTSPGKQLVESPIIESRGVRASIQTVRSKVPKSRASTPSSPPSSPDTRSEDTRMSLTGLQATAPERSQVSPNRRLPIWARGTVSQPIVRSPQSQSTNTLKHAKSQSLATTRTNASKRPTRSASLDQSGPRNNSPLEGSRSRLSTATSVTTPTARTRYLASPSSATRSNATHKTASPRTGSQITRASTIITATSTPARAVAKSKIPTTPRRALTLPSNASHPTGTPSALVRTAPSSSAILRAITSSPTPTTSNPSAIRRSLLSHGTHALRSVASQPILRQPKNSSSLKSRRKPSEDYSQRGQQKTETSEVEDGECCICMNAESDCVLYRCGHVCACIECARKLNECPICREKVLDVIKMYKI